MSVLDKIMESDEYKIGHSMGFEAGFIAGSQINIEFEPETTTAGTTETLLSILKDDKTDNGSSPLPPLN